VRGLLRDLVRYTLGASAKGIIAYPQNLSILAKYFLLVIILSISRSDIHHGAFVQGW
jgi:hypothetical protein